MLMILVQRQKLLMTSRLSSLIVFSAIKQAFLLLFPHLSSLFRLFELK